MRNSRDALLPMIDMDYFYLYFIHKLNSEFSIVKHPWDLDDVAAATTLNRLTVFICYKVGW